MKKITIYIATLLMLSTAIVSCIRDEISDCPPLKVNLAVKDKNYFNVSKVELEDTRPTDLPFREYIPTLYYTLRNLDTGEYVEDSGVFDVDGNGQTVPIQFCDCLPHGKYVLTVWGGLDDEDPLEDDPLTINFHPTNNIGNDIYLTNDTILYDPYHYEYTFEMERTKGKLLIQLENLHEGYESSVNKVDNLFSRASNDFRYYETTHVSHQSQWSGKETVTKTVLTPSCQPMASNVSVAISNPNDATAPTLSPADVRVTMNRNELTVLKYSWNETKNDFEIYVLINDNWELVHGMEIEPVE